MTCCIEVKDCMVALMISMPGQAFTLYWLVHCINNLWGFVGLRKAYIFINYNACIPSGIHYNAKDRRSLKMHFFYKITSMSMNYTPTNGDVCVYDIWNSTNLYSRMSGNYVLCTAPVVVHAVRWVWLVWWLFLSLLLIHHHHSLLVRTLHPLSTSYARGLNTLELLTNKCCMHHIVKTLAL